MKVKDEADDKVKESLRETSDTMTLEMSPRVKESERSFGAPHLGTFKGSKVMEEIERCRKTNAITYGLWFTGLRVNIEEYEKGGERPKKESIPRCAFGNIYGTPSCQRQCGGEDGHVKGLTLRM